MNSVFCLLLVIAAGANASLLPFLQFNPCKFTMCTMDIKICPDGTRAPVPVGQCCPSLSACKPLKPITGVTDCSKMMCTMVLLICPDGSRAPIPEGGCCPSLSACKNGNEISKRNANPLASLLGSNLGSNLLSGLTSATHGTDIGTVLSILNALNAVHQLSNDIHSIPTVLNHTLQAILNETSQAFKPKSRANPLASLLGGNLGSNLLSGLTSATHGTDIGTVLSILNALNAVHQLSNDIHSIPTVLNNTLQAILNGTSQVFKPQSRANPLASLLGGNLGSNLLSGLTSATHGTDIGTVLSILNALNAVHQLSNDIHSIPAVLNQTLHGILNSVQQVTTPVSHSF